MTPLFAAILPVLILMCGLALDTSMMELKKVQMQNAADAAAVAAELELERDGTATTTVGTTTSLDYITSAQEDAALNGFTNGSNGVTVTVTNPPTYGEYSGRYDAVEVIISAPANVLFMGYINGNTKTLTAYAAALEPPCDYAMNTNNVTHSVVLTLSNISSTCPIYAQGGVGVDGPSWLSAQAFDITGASGASSILGKTTPSPNYSVATVPDPLANITAPVFSACTVTNWSKINTSGGLPAYNLSPGTYCGGITANEVQMNFSPGLYIITGGISWTNSMAICSACTFYFTKGGGSSYGVVSIGGNSSILLNAPTTASGGSIPGVVFFLDRAWTPVSPAGFQCNDAYFVGNGIYYSLNTALSFTTCSNSPSAYFGVVTSNLVFTGTVYTDTFGLIFYSNYSSLPTGNPFRTKAVLVQ
jgi:hypothetical protein